MSLIASLYTGNTGLHANSVGVGVVGDNIANSNTVGFKASRAHFQELFAQSLFGAAAGPNQLGKGTALQRIEKVFTQGAVKGTGIPTDMALVGDGFFVLGGTDGPGARTYSRAGDFRFDDQGFLVNPAGLRVQGFAAIQGAAPGGETLSQTLSDLQVTNDRLQPRATGQVEIEASLRPDDPIYPAFDPADPDGSSSYHTSATVYDSLGNAHQVDLYGTRIAEGTWDFNVVLSAGELAAGAPATINLGTLGFDEQGRLLDDNTAPAQIAWAGAAAADVTFELGEAINEGGTGTEGTTTWNDVSESGTSFLSQDGYGTGELDLLAVDNRGVLIGSYTNGQTRVLGQVAVARFPDPTGLSALGGNVFAETLESGLANVGAAGAGGRGTLMSGSLEMSNVEISDQFIELIAYQRGYQSNARTISTADQLLQEVFQLLR